MLDTLAVLQAATAVAKTAAELLSALQVHRDRCTLMVNRCQRLLDEVFAQCEKDQAALGLMQQKLVMLESACVSARDTIAGLGGKGLAWRLLHKEQIEKTLEAAEAKVADVFIAFHVDVRLGEIQAEIADVSKIDHQRFVDYLEEISQTDQKIIDAFRSDKLRFEETLMALMKHVQMKRLNSKVDHTFEDFINRAVSALQKVSGEPSQSILPWQITSLEVEYQRTDEDCLGSGGFGKVFRGQWLGEVVAVKEMHQAWGANAHNERQVKAFQKEIKIWLKLNHPRILPLYGACLESDKPFLVAKYCPNGNIMDYIRDNSGVNRLLMLHQVSSGMMYLHSQSVIHADLKAANILVGEDHKALICDFGLSYLNDQETMSSSTTSHSMQGTLNYMAPEYLEGDPIDFPVDVYSFGLTAWQIYTGLVPFSEVPRRAFHRWIIDRQERPEYPNSMNKALWAIIQQCWQHEAPARPTFPEIEASMKLLIEPYTKQNRRQTLPLRPRLAFSQVPTPPRSIISEDISLSPIQPFIPVIKEQAWFSLPESPVSPISYPISSNSIQVFTNTLPTLDEPRALDKYVAASLICYPNWLKVSHKLGVNVFSTGRFTNLLAASLLLQYRVYNSRGQHPRNYILKNRVKNVVKEFKKTLLAWVDNIPSIKNNGLANKKRTVLLLIGICTMAEYTHRQNPDAPHLYVQDFISSGLNKSAFRAKAEKQVSEAWDHYTKSRDTKVLVDKLAGVVNQICP